MEQDGGSNTLLSTRYPQVKEATTELISTCQSKLIGKAAIELRGKVKFVVYDKEHEVILTMYPTQCSIMVQQSGEKSRYLDHLDGMTQSQYFSKNILEDLGVKLMEENPGLDNMIPIMN